MSLGVIRFSSPCADRIPRSGVRLSFVSLFVLRSHGMRASPCRILRRAPRYVSSLGGLGGRDGAGLPLGLRPVAKPARSGRTLARRRTRGHGGARTRPSRGRVRLAVLPGRPRISLYSSSTLRILLMILFVRSAAATAGARGRGPRQGFTQEPTTSTTLPLAWPEASSPSASAAFSNG